jgi:hypothetical protein
MENAEVQSVSRHFHYLVEISIFCADYRLQITVSLWVHHFGGEAQKYYKNISNNIYYYIYNINIIYK